MTAMGQLHLTKVAVGCATVDELRDRIAGRGHDGRVTIETRYRPVRADGLVGGSLYWIVRHRLVARQQILAFGETDAGRCAIHLEAICRPVLPRPRRAHQGWRYLDGLDTPGDIADDVDIVALPLRLSEELALLGLI